MTIAFRLATREDLVAEEFIHIAARLYRCPPHYLMGYAQPVYDSRDRGDEDDVDLLPPHQYSLSRDLARRMASTGFRMRVGPAVCYWPAERLPTPPDHDGGDEEPRLRIRRYMEGL